jgi:hypothetical protein
MTLSDVGHAGQQSDRVRSQLEQVPVRCQVRFGARVPDHTIFQPLQSSLADELYGHV